MQTLNQRQTCKKVKRVAVYNNAGKKCRDRCKIFIPQMYFFTLNFSPHLYTNLPGEDQALNLMGHLPLEIKGLLRLPVTWRTIKEGKLKSTLIHHQEIRSCRDGPVSRMLPHTHKHKDQSSIPSTYIKKQVVHMDSQHWSGRHDVPAASWPTSLT